MPEPRTSDISLSQGAAADFGKKSAEVASTVAPTNTQTEGATSKKRVSIADPNFTDLEKQKLGLAMM